ncbi:RNA polymerase sigma factor, sigma-70 family [Nonomuraea maritima]|uniref:RNA polymerase sigma factor, sigma-70 family n=1 Tax=Nonomuraea maritima TaxID=683260 RepID=A0A1G8V0H0_9ACTN|nr:sigma-70 family RNA polymerase sigma factor [Nonomuraea maritima]SDJ58690.1 RNA polymerase sigma factor, sigma-70 family [Nonomuraea maritima]
MPGWPTVDRADDQELVEALRRADSDAPARLYDAYAERLYDYAFSLSRSAGAGPDRDLAADSVHDALVTAQGCVDRLREPARLRAWLYALTRFQVRARLAHRSGTPAGGTPLPGQVAHDDVEPADAELTALVHETLAELSRGEREVLELSVRHGLTPAEVGAVLGLTSRQASTRLGRTRDLLENAAAAVVLAKTGRAHCPDLSAMVDSWEGPLTPLLRRRLSGHIGGCEVCTEGRHRQVSVARLLDLVPVAYPGLSLRRRVIDTCVRPELDRTRTLITDRGDSFDRTGFPVVAERRSRRRPRRLAPALLVGACLTAATGAVIAVNGGGASDPAALTLAPSPSLPPEAEVVVEDEITPEAPSETEADDPTPSPRRTPATRRDEPGGSGVPEVSAPSARPVVSRPRPRPSAAPTTTRRGSSAGARLGVACPRTVDDAAQIGLSARNAAVSWVATAAQGLDVQPASGSVKAGGSAVVWVAVVDPTEPGTGRITFTSNGGTATCTVSWEGSGVHLPELPTDDPPSTHQPSASRADGPSKGPDVPGASQEREGAGAARLDG